MAEVRSTDVEVEKDPINGKHDFLFVKHPLEPWPLWWNEGEVYTKNPDKHTVKKLIEIAQQLNARVLGDDGEQYTDWTKFPLPAPPIQRSKNNSIFGRLLRK